MSNRLVCLGWMCLWCGVLMADGIGMHFIDASEETAKLQPLSNSGFELRSLPAFTEVDLNEDRQMELLVGTSWGGSGGPAAGVYQRQPKDGWGSILDLSCRADLAKPKVNGYYQVIEYSKPYWDGCFVGVYAYEGGRYHERYREYHDNKRKFNTVNERPDRPRNNLAAIAGRLDQAFLLFCRLDWSISSGQRVSANSFLHGTGGAASPCTFLLTSDKPEGGAWQVPGTAFYIVECYTNALPVNERLRIQTTIRDTVYAVTDDPAYHDAKRLTDQLFIGLEARRIRTRFRPNEPMGADYVTTNSFVRVTFSRTNTTARAPHVVTGHLTNATLYVTAEIKGDLGIREILLDYFKRGNWPW